MNETPSSAVEVVREFWQLMATNDFASVGAVLADSYVLDWPQSNERIRGRVRFAAMNKEYPANGQWVFTVHRIVGGQNEAVSEVSITDGVQHAKAISFFTVAEGKITHQVEYWPEPYPAPSNRKHLVEAIQ
jgi:ketosteroid isomerase-like protein